MLLRAFMYVVLTAGYSVDCSGGGVPRQSSVFFSRRDATTFLDTPHSRQRRGWLTVSLDEECSETCSYEEVDEHYNDYNKNTIYLINDACGRRTSCDSCVLDTPNKAWNYNNKNLPIKCRPVNGGWSAWSSWTVCTVPHSSQQCGTGREERRRFCDSPRPRYGGSKCTGQAEESRKCRLPPCPVDGGWSRWSTWSACSKRCDGGKQTRRRSCTDPAPEHGGATCPGSAIETQRCAETSCSACRVEYAETVDVHAEEALEAGNITTTEAECLQLCTESPVCRALDYDHMEQPWHDTRCWLHKVRREVNQVNMYIRAPCVIKPGCRDSFVQELDSKVDDGVGVMEAKTREECEELCLNSDSYCESYDWVVSDNPWKNTRCWLHEDVITLKEIQGINHFVKETCSEQDETA